jgi:hypothetical protein
MIPSARTVDPPSNGNCVGVDINRNFDFSGTIWRNSRLTRGLVLEILRQNVYRVLQPHRSQRLKCRLATGHASTNSLACGRAQRCPGHPAQLGCDQNQTTEPDQTFLNGASTESAAA